MHIVDASCKSSSQLKRKAVTFPLSLTNCSFAGSRIQVNLQNKEANHASLVPTTKNEHELENTCCFFFFFCRKKGLSFLEKVEGARIFSLPFI